LITYRQLIKEHEAELKRAWRNAEEARTEHDADRWRTEAAELTLEIEWLESMDAFNEFVTIPFGNDWFRMNYIMNKLIFDSYYRLIIENDIEPEDVVEFVKEHGYLRDIILDRDHPLSEQPVLYLTCYLLDRFPYQACELWPLTPEELEPYLRMLGISWTFD